MDFKLLLDNLSNPALVFFFLGILAVNLKSDLEIPASSSKFISLYLLFSIGFKGGQELAHSHFDAAIFNTILFGIFLSIIIPIYCYFILRRRLDIHNSGAIAAAYGSVSAVTFVTAISFLEIEKIDFGGHLVAIMAMMEAPAIVIGVLLIGLFDKENKDKVSIAGILKHSLTNGSVFLILGSLFAGWLASDAQAQGIKPFTTDIFKGFLAIFLLDMGITSGRKLSVFFKNGWFTFLFSIAVPLFNGCWVALASQFVTESVGDRFLLAILAASASYIAVPAAMRMAVPKANPSIYIPMALAVTFPLNITIGMPIYLFLITASG